MQAGQVAANVIAVLRGKAPKAVGGLPFDVIAVATGRERAAGRLGYFGMPSFMFHKAKGKTLVVERIPEYVNGSIA